LFGIFVGFGDGEEPHTRNKSHPRSLFVIYLSSIQKKIKNKIYRTPLAKPANQSIEKKDLI